MSEGAPHTDHDAVRAVRREFSDWRPWITRVLVITFAALAGLSIVGFTWLTDVASAGFQRIAAIAWWLPFVWVPAATAAAVWATRRFAAGAAGSGIPQVMATLDTAVAAAEIPLFVSLRLAAAKVLLTAWGLLAGLSLGREGPSVQIAAGVLHSVRRWLPERTAINEHGLLIAGGAAGIAAAFNAPLAGVMFAIEELSRRPEQRSSGLLVAAIVLAGLMGVSAYGNATYFGVIRVPPLDWALLGPGIVVTLLSGVAGGLFSRLLLRSLAGSADRISAWRTRHPIWFAAGCGGAVALIAIVTQGATWGSGYAYTRGLLDGTQSAPIVYAFSKFVATWLTVWSGVPGGLFAPALAIGAGIGNDVALLTHHPDHAALIALGMAGFLAAVTQAPLTAFIIVMEMIDGHSMVLSLMACALVASLVARLIGPPLYASLAQSQVRQLATKRAAALVAPMAAAPIPGGDAGAVDRHEGGAPPAPTAS
ncbi:MAG: chloride channel protein [Caldimonas sp.]